MKKSVLALLSVLTLLLVSGCDFEGSEARDTYKPQGYVEFNGTSYPLYLYHIQEKSKVVPYVRGTYSDNAAITMLMPQGYYGDLLEEDVKVLYPRSETGDANASGSDEYTLWKTIFFAGKYPDTIQAPTIVATPDLFKIYDASPAIVTDKSTLTLKPSILFDFRNVPVAESVRLISGEGEIAELALRDCVTIPEQTFFYRNLAKRLLRQMKAQQERAEELKKKREGA